MYFRDVPNLGLWRTDFETGQTLWSREMFVSYGLMPETHSPSVDVLMKYLHRDDRDMVSDAIHQATKSLTPFSFFHRIVRKDRSVRRLYSMGRFEIQENGKATCRHGICLDLTALTKDEMKDVQNRLSVVTLPCLSVLLSLDASDKNMSILLEVASMVNDRSRDRIARANSRSSLT
ncbi:MAG TPA: PAS domain-containing protein [Cyclobacteriaceae bacterium]|nr:PAS domain-containing protein [Cyclobacteriaceae bacterium]